jgi:hypothetical protein
VIGAAKKARRTRREPGELTDQDRAAIRAAVLALPPLTDEQVDALCETIVATWARWSRENSNR